MQDANQFRIAKNALGKRYDIRSVKIVLLGPLAIESYGSTGRKVINDTSSARRVTQVP